MKNLKATKGIEGKRNSTTTTPPAVKLPVTLVESKLAKVTKAPVETPTKVPVPPSASAPIQTTSSTATIEVKMDVGFGNQLYLRGEGKGLDWNHGIPLTCVDGSTWQWSGVAEDKLKFKLLLNDAVWAQGEDLVIAPGQKLQVSPSF